MKTAPLRLACLALLAPIGLAWAKPPTLTGLFPPGGQRGQTVPVTALGTFERWPVGVSVEGRGIEVEADRETGRLLVDIADDAEPGVHWLRLVDDDGASTLRPFVVGTVPEILAIEPKDTAEGPLALDGEPITVNGRLEKNGDVDGFALSLKKGQTLVASVEANRRLGAPMDAVLQVVSPAGFVLAQADDEHGLDPETAFDVPEDGTYVVRVFAFPAVPDSRIGFAGGESFLYRLTLTTGGFLDHVLPLAVPRDRPGTVEAHGWNIPDAARRLPVVADETSDDAPVAHPLLANTTAVRLVPHPARSESEPNDADHPEPLVPPVTITGRIDPARDRDVFRFAATKGMPLTFRVESRSLGAPLDPVVRVTDAAGKVLVEVDDTGKARDPELTFNPPADGDYRLGVRDLHGRGGDRFVYLLTALTPEPDYRLTLASDRLTLTPGKPLDVVVTVARSNGFDGAIEILALGLPDGVTAPPARSEPRGSSSRSVTLSLTSLRGGPSGPIRVIGTSAGALPRERTARAPIAGFEATTGTAWLTVLMPPETPKPARETR